MDQWRLPRSTGNLAADWLAASAALRDATTEHQRAAVRMRVASLIERQGAHNEWQRESLHTIIASMRPVLDQAVEMFRSWVEQLRPVLATGATALAELGSRPARIGAGSLMDLDGRATAAAIARARARRGHGPPPRPLDPRRR